MRAYKVRQTWEGGAGPRAQRFDDLDAAARAAVAIATSSRRAELVELAGAGVEARAVRVWLAPGACGDPAEVRAAPVDPEDAAGWVLAELVEDVAREPAPPTSRPTWAPSSGGPLLVEPLASGAYRVTCGGVLVRGPLALLALADRVFEGDGEGARLVDAVETWIPCGLLGLTGGSGCVSLSVGLPLYLHAREGGRGGVGFELVAELRGPGVAVPATWSDGAAVRAVPWFRVRS